MRDERGHATVYSLQTVGCSVAAKEFAQTKGICGSSYTRRFPATIRTRVNTWRYLCMCVCMGGWVDVCVCVCV